MLRSKQDSKSEPAVGSQKKRAVRKNDSTVKHGAVAEFRLQLRRFLAFSEANARRHNLTSQQYQALLTIKGLSLPHQHMSVGELADFLLIKRYTAGRLISGMTGTGLLKRYRDGRDGRRILVMLTRKGEQRLSKVAGLNWLELRSRQLALPKILKSIY
jgi:DNA-binding MarR family transcriptional regulator